MERLERHKGREGGRDGGTEGEAEKGVRPRPASSQLASTEAGSTTLSAIQYSLVVDCLK